MSLPRQTGGPNADTEVDIVTLTGTGTPEPVAVIDVSPMMLNFGEVSIGSSVTQQVSITNTGNADLTLSGVTLGVGSSEDFGLLAAPDFPVVVTSGATIAVTIVYQPAVLGSVTGTVEIASNATNAAVSVVSLSGTGEAVPVATIDVQADVLEFGDVEIGSPQTQTVTVTNVGTADLTVTNLDVTGADFSLAQAPTLPAIILPGMTVQIDVLYQPTAVGSTTGLLEILSDATNEPAVIVNLSGTGQPVPVAQIAVQPDVVAFGDTEVGSSQFQTVTVTNLGTADLTVSSLIVTDGDFALGQAPGLPAVIVPNASVQVELIYAPTAPGLVTGTLEILSDAANAPLLTISLNGTGLLEAATQISIQPTGLAFGEVEVGSTQRQLVTVTNVGDSELTVSDLVLTGGDFTIGQTPVLPIVIAPSDAVLIEVVYQPSAPGFVTATLDIQSDAANAPTATVSLSGTGQEAAVAQIAVEPASFVFGEVEIGSRQSQIVTINNVGTVNLTVSDVSVTGADFVLGAIPPNLPVVILPNASAQVEIVFQPTVEGLSSGSLSITSDAADTPLVSIDLSGTGTAVPVAQAAVQPTALAFGAVEIGSLQSQSVTISNVGTADLTVSDVSVTGADFALGTAPVLPVVIVPNASVPVEVVYQPTAPVASTGTLIIQSDAADTPLVSVDLSGTGQAVALAQIDVQPTALAFGEVQVGALQSQSVTMSNVGTAALTVSDVSVTGADFVLDAVPELPTIMAPSTSIQVNVIYQPTAVGSVTGSLSIQSDATDTPLATVDLSGTGLAVPVAQIDVQPAALAYGDVAVGMNQSQTVSVSNIGTATLTISDLFVTGSAFSLSETAILPLVLEPGAAVQVDVTYEPAVVGSDTGTLVLQSNDPNNAEVIVSIGGSGIAAPIIDAQPAIVIFPPLDTDQPQVASLTLTNLGLLDLTVTALTITGAGFTLGLVPSLPVVLVPGASEQVDIVFQPLSSGLTSGSLDIVSDAINGSPFTIPFEGVAQIDVQPVSLLFGSLGVGNTQSQAVTLANTGTANLTITAVSITGSDFALNQVPILPTVLAPGTSLPVSVAYQPTAEGAATGSLVIESDAPNGLIVTVPLSGSGIPVPALVQP